MDLAPPGAGSALRYQQTCVRSSLVCQGMAGPRASRRCSLVVEYQLLPQHNSARFDQVRSYIFTSRNSLLLPLLSVVLHGIRSDSTEKVE